MFLAQKKRRLVLWLSDQHRGIRYACLNSFIMHLSLRHNAEKTTLLCNNAAHHDSLDIAGRFADHDTHVNILLAAQNAAEVADLSICITI